MPKPLMRHQYMQIRDPFDHLRNILNTTLVTGLCLYRQLSIKELKQSFSRQQNQFSTQMHCMIHINFDSFLNNFKHYDVDGYYAFENFLKIPIDSTDNEKKIINQISNFIDMLNIFVLDLNKTRLPGAQDKINIEATRKLLEEIREQINRKQTLRNKEKVFQKYRNILKIIMFFIREQGKVVCSIKHSNNFWEAQYQKSLDLPTDPNNFLQFQHVIAGMLGTVNVDKDIIDLWGKIFPEEDMGSEKSLHNVGSKTMGTVPSTERKELSKQESEALFQTLGGNHGVAQNKPNASSGKNKNNGRRRRRKNKKQPVHDRTTANSVDQPSQPTPEQSSAPSTPAPQAQDTPNDSHGWTQSKSRRGRRKDKRQQAQNQTNESTSQQQNMTAVTAVSPVISELDVPDLLSLSSSTSSTGSNSDVSEISNQYPNECTSETGVIPTDTTLLGDIYWRDYISPVFDPIKNAIQTHFGKKAKIYMNGSSVTLYAWLVANKVFINGNDVIAQRCIDYLIAGKDFDFVVYYDQEKYGTDINDPLGKVISQLQSSNKFYFVLTQKNNRFNQFRLSPTSASTRLPEIDLTYKKHGEAIISYTDLWMMVDSNKQFIHGDLEHLQSNTVSISVDGSTLDQDHSLLLRLPHALATLQSEIRKLNSFRSGQSYTLVAFDQPSQQCLQQAWSRLIAAECSTNPWARREKYFHRLNQYIYSPSGPEFMQIVSDLGLPELFIPKDESTNSEEYEKIAKENINAFIDYSNQHGVLNLFHFIIQDIGTSLGERGGHAMNQIVFMHPLTMMLMYVSLAADYSAVRNHGARTFNMSLPSDQERPVHNFFREYNQIKALTDVPNGIVRQTQQNIVRYRDNPHQMFYSVPPEHPVGVIPTATACRSASMHH